MKNLDLENNSDMEIKAKLIEAISNDNAEAFADAQLDFAKSIEARVLQEAKQLNEYSIDHEVMVKRGFKPLTTEEKTFYNAITDTATLDNQRALMPRTIIDRVFEDLEQNYELLKEIEFVNTTGVTEWVSRTSESEGAWWGKLCDEIKKKLEASFEIKETDLFKLSAYVPICKAMLKLGPEWLDRFVRIILAESIYIALEDAIINGTGKEMPIGMIKDLEAPVVAGEYANKATVPLTDLTPATLGSKIMSPLTKNGKRVVNNVLMIVNPLDYWSKVFGATTYLTTSGTYVHGVLPINAKIIQSQYMAVGKMVAGLPKDYFMGVGSTSEIEYSDHYHYLEDERVYITKQYANGLPKDNDSFIVFDISGLTSSLQAVIPEA